MLAATYGNSARCRLERWWWDDGGGGDLSLAEEFAGWNPLALRIPLSFLGGEVFPEPHEYHYPHPSHDPARSLPPLFPLRLRRQHQQAQVQKAAQKPVPSVAASASASRAAGRPQGYGPGITPRESLREMRVVQRTLVYVIGLSPSYARESTLRRPELFGQFGRVVKVVVNRSALSATDGRLASAAAYVTYTKEADARLAILAVDGFVHDGRVLRCSFGTTKHCSAWLRDAPCTTPDCMFLHDYGDPEVSFSREEMLTTNAYGRVFSELVHPAAPGYCTSMPSAGTPAVFTGLGPGGSHVAAGALPVPAAPVATWQP